MSVEDWLPENIPHWNSVDVERCANGWIVRQSRPFDRPTVISPASDVFVFVHWDECAAFMQRATMGKPAAPEVKP